MLDYSLSPSLSRHFFTMHFMSGHSVLRLVYICNVPIGFANRLGWTVGWSCWRLRNFTLLKLISAEQHGQGKWPGWRDLVAAGVDSLCGGLPCIRVAHTFDVASGPSKEHGSWGCIIDTRDCAQSGSSKD